MPRCLVRPDLFEFPNDRRLRLEVNCLDCATIGGEDGYGAACIAAVSPCGCGSRIDMSRDGIGGQARIHARRLRIGSGIVRTANPGARPAAAQVLRYTSNREWQNACGPEAPRRTTAPLDHSVASWSEMGDAVEIEALARLYRSWKAPLRPCEQPTFPCRAAVRNGRRRSVDTDGLAVVTPAG